MILPTIHMNGTSPEELKRGYNAARTAVIAAQECMGKIEFNARDYYPQGPEAFTQARKEFTDCVIKLNEVESYLLDVEMHIYEFIQDRDERRAERGQA